MSPTAELLTLLALSPVILAGFHAALSRSFRGVPPQIGAVAAIGLGSLPVAWGTAKILGGMAGTEQLAGAAYAVLVFGSIGYAYFHVFNMSETARRIRILYEIHRSGSLSEEQILSQYRTPYLIQVRLKRLEETFQLERRGERFVLKGRTLYFVTCALEAWSALLGFRKFGGLTAPSRH
jgi:hypothetical protein